MIGLLLACARPAPIDPRPDVVLITVDTLRADRLGFAGHAEAHTPALDALAARGRVYDAATTPFPRTTPALGSLHTGLLPLRHGSREVGQVVRADGRLAGWLAEAGYRTAAVDAMRVAGPEQRMDVGFDTFDLAHDAPAAALAARAAEVAAGLDPGGPAFLWVHFADPHFPYLPPPDGPLRPDAPGCRALGEAAAAGRLERATLFSDRDGRASAALPECRALYDAEIAAVDAGVGALLAALDAARGDRPRLVVLTADHGENQGEGGLFYEHGPDLSDAAVRVPLVLAGPGVTPGRDAGVARLQDVAPTVLALLGLPAPADLDGVPLRTGDGGAAGPDLALVESGAALHTGLFGYLVSGRERRWCVNEGPWSWCTLAGGRAGLFDHVADPRLRTDVAAAHPDVAARLSAAAARWRPEQVHARAARSATHALVATPTVDGWVRTSSRLDAPGVPVDDPAPLAVLGPALDGFAARLDALAGAPVSDEDAAALRALGYVE